MKTTIPWHLKGTYSAKSLLKRKVTDIPLLWELGIPGKGISIVAGSSDTGKSCFLRNLAIEYSIGSTEFLGYRLMGNKRHVVYVSTEDDDDAVSVLLKKHLSQHDDQVIPKIRFIFNTERLLERIETLMANNPVGLVIIDALSDIFPGQINAVNEVRKFMHQYHELALKLDTSVMFLHHTSKRTEELPPSKNNFIGSQGLEGKSRVAYEFRRDPCDSTLRHLCVVKGNYLPDSMKERSYGLRFNTSSLAFERTDIRLNFNEIRPISTDPNEDLKRRAVELKREGLKNIQIIQKLAEEGHREVSPSTMSDWVRGVTPNNSDG